MPREKHGRYDARKRLPDNTMQPQESGLFVWLQQQVIETLGNEQAQALIEESRTHGVNRYKWLIAQLQEQGYTELVEQYNKHRLADAAQTRIRDKRRYLANCQRQLEIETSSERRIYLQGEIQKATRYLHDRGEHV